MAMFRQREKTAGQALLCNYLWFASVFARRKIRSRLTSLIPGRGPPCSMGSLRHLRHRHARLYRDAMVLTVIQLWALAIRA